MLATGSSNLKDLKAGTYKLERFCMEPTSFNVKEESQFKGGDTNFVKTRLMTRLTYTLDGVRARGAVGGGGGPRAAGGGMWRRGSERATRSTRPRRRRRRPPTR